MSYETVTTYETTTYGKWILAGEHAVLRGHPAIVFPLKDKPLTLHYTPSSTPLSLKYDGESAATCEASIWQLLTKALDAIQKDLKQITGVLHIHNQVPIGTGLGASAALSVAITRWLKALYAPKLNVFEFARSLEHLFHGQSSGLDIAGSSATDAVYFQSGHITPLTPTWTPAFTLSYSGAPSVTADCIQKTKILKKTNQEQADAVDHQMALSVKQAYAALTHEPADAESQSQLSDAIRSACDCFDAWGLINSNLKTHINDLYQQGALAVKPTGSGNGGYVLSLWKSTNLINTLHSQ